MVIISNLRTLAQTREEFDNLIFYIPQGLSVSKTTNSMILTDVTTGNGQKFTITVNKPVVSFKKMEKSFPKYWRELLIQEGYDNPPEEPPFIKFQNNAGWICSRGGKLVKYSGQSTPAWYHLTIMRYLGITVQVVTKSDTEELFIQKLSLLMQLVISVELKNRSYQNNQGPATSSLLP